MPGSVPASLELAEAVELASAWVASTARANGIRLLTIKGNALARQGLRKQRIPGDVDVLVAPEDFARLCAAIARAGWKARPQTLVGEAWSQHSTSFMMQGWPCDIDVHRYYPGLLTERGRAFDALWTAREAMCFAGQPVDVPSRAGNAILLALHSLRDGLSNPRHREELTGLLNVDFPEDERAELVRLARDTGALGSLSDILPALGVAPEAMPDVADSTELLEWRSRVAANSSGAYFWLVTLKRAPWRRKPSVLFRALWPTRRDLLIAHPEMPDTLIGRTRVRIARLPGGLGGLPTSIRALRRQRRIRRIPAPTKFE